jgi:hypothetical protein
LVASVWFRSLVAGAAAAMMSVAASAGAQPASSLPIATDGTCPDPAAVQRILATLFSATESTAPASIGIADLGSRYRVSVGDRTKTYGDPHRNCAERARIAAAFIALALNPEEVSPPVESEPPPLVALPVPLETPSRSEVPKHVEFGVRAGGAVQSAPELGALAFGVGVRLAALWTRVGAHAACGWVSTGTFALAGGGAAVSLDRVPCAAGATFALLPPAERVQLTLDAGLAIGALWVAGHGLATDFAASRVEVGTRLALESGVHVGPPDARLFPVIGIEATYLPMSYDLEVASRGSVGQTPHWWAGATAGLCWRID